MFCKNCGAEIPDDSKHCKECGFKLVEDTSNDIIIKKDFNNLDGKNKNQFKATGKNNVIYDLDAPDVKEAIANGAKVNYLGKEKIHSQIVRIITILVGLIVGTIIFPVLGTIIGAAIGYWISKEEKDAYFLEYPDN